MDNDVRCPDGNIPTHHQATGFFYRIRTQLLLTFGTIAVLGVLIIEAVGLLGLPLVGLEGSIEQTRQRSLQTLNEIANSRRETLQEWLEERRRDTRVLAESEVISGAVTALAHQMADQVKRGQTDATDWASYRRDPRQIALMRELRALRNSSNGLYEAVGFLDVDTGFVIASSRDEAIGVNLLGDPLFERTRTPGYLEVIETFLSPVDGQHYLVLTQQIFERDGEGNKAALRAIAVFLVRPETIPLAGGGLVGLGQTGETLLVNHDRLILSPLRHPLPNGAVARVMNDRLDSRIAQLAAGGGEGLIVDRDYRGVPVLAAYRYVLVSPELGWGIIVKQDETEVLAPIYQRLKQRLMLALLSLGIMGVAVVVVSRHLSAPISALAAAAQELEAGNLAARSGLVRRDEIGLLARTFDAMAQRVQEWHESLNRELEIRTRMLFAREAERQQAEEEIRQLNDKLEERVLERTNQLEAANKELETFAYSVSHDLKAPLRGIDGYSRLLLDGYADRLDEEGRLFVQNVRRGASQMNMLIDDLLTYSRMERRTLHRAPLDLRQLVDSVVAERNADIAAQGATMHIDLPPLSMQADFDGLAHVLRNLLDNALKFSRPGVAVEIEISGQLDETSATLWVKDNGIGFDPKFHDRIFEIFQRLQRTEEYSGTGIGLSIVRKAMQRMGGRVWAESVPGQGSTFFLELPA